MSRCDLCERKDVEITIHHLLPKEMDGIFGPTANLCIPYHKQIHALYTNEEIAARLTSIHQLKEDPLLSHFLKWIQKQPATKLMKIKKSKDRKRRR